MPDRDQAMRIAGEVAARLAVAAPPDAPRLAARARAWLSQLRHQHRTAQQAGTGTAVSDAHIELAVGIVSRLAGNRTRTLTHGDLSPSNILRADRGWVAVDPMLLAGPPEWEAHTVLRDHLPEIVAAEDPVAVSVRWTRAFADAAGLDRSEAMSLSFARSVASYYWESQHCGDRSAVAHLRRLVTVTARAMGA